MDKNALQAEALKWRNWFFRGQSLWSAAYHVAVFGSIICSITAGALIQNDKGRFATAATVFTSVAAALTAIGSTGGFERKWRCNRLSRGRIDALLLDLEDDAPNLPDLVTRLKEIIAMHDGEIVGERPSSPEKGKT